ncbi:MAG: DMT family transporter [Eubacteriaceae bacterium]
MRTIGIFAAISAAFAAGAIPFLTKLLMIEGLEPGGILFYRYSFVFVLLGVTLLIKKENLKVKKKQLVNLLLFSIFGYGGATFLLAVSFNYMPMGLATMLYFTYPLFVVLILGVVFREKPTPKKCIALVIAILGIAFLMNFNFDLINFGSLLAIGAGLTYGIYLVGLEKSCLKEVNNSVIVFYLGGISAIMFGIQGVVTTGGLNFAAISPKALLMTMVLGGTTIFVLEMVTFAIKKIGSTQTSLIIAFEAVVTLVLGIVIINEPWNYMTVVGSVLMLVAVILVSISSDSDISLESHQ